MAFINLHIFLLVIIDLSLIGKQRIFSINFQTLKFLLLNDLMYLGLDKSIFWENIIII